MDSLAGNLRADLPSQDTDFSAEQLDAFRAAAASLTGFFKAGKRATKKAHLTGKREALQDVLSFVQSGYLDRPTAYIRGSSTRMERVIDYICARQEALRAEEEAEGEDDVEPQSQRAHVPSTKTNSTRPNLNTFRSTVHHPIVSTHPPHNPARRQDISDPRVATSVTPSSAPTSPLQSALPLYVHGHASSSTLRPLSSSATSLTHINSSHTSSVPSSVTRLQARRERERERKGKASGPRDVDADRAIELFVNVDGNDANVPTGMKRRWAAPISTTEVDLSADNIDAASTDGAAFDGRPDVDMDGFEGLGERPSKRTARR